MLIHIRLLDEGSSSARPTQALEIGDGLFRVIATPDYDPENEVWEFPPESIVGAEKQFFEGKEYFLAVSPPHVRRP